MNKLANKRETMQKALNNNDYWNIMYIRYHLEQHDQTRIKNTFKVYFKQETWSSCIFVWLHKIHIRVWSWQINIYIHNIVEWQCNNNMNYILARTKTSFIREYQENCKVLSELSIMRLELCFWDICFCNVYHMILDHYYHSVGLISLD